MSYLSALLGPAEPPPENVKVGAWVLCADCSKGIHTTYHSQINPCGCDLCKKDAS